ncbi:hypothetical protein ACWDTT_10480 [Streptosporangium sandarakinum]
MAISIITEVFDSAPAEVKNVERLVLLALADSAEEDSRMVWLGIKELLRKTAAKKTAVHEAIARLLDRGVLQDVAPEAWPEKAKGCTSIVRRITTVDFWEEGCPAPIYTLPDTPDSGVPAADDTNPCSPESGTNPYTPSFGRSTKYSVLRRQQPQGGKYVRTHDGDDEVGDSIPDGGDEDWDAQPTARRRTRTPGPDTGLGLADYFAEKVSRAGGWRGLDIGNRRNLAATLNRWKASGATPDFIRAMVDAYVGVPGLRRADAYAPVADFISRRGQLLAHVKRAENVEAAQPETFTAADGDFDADAWKRHHRRDTPAQPETFTTPDGDFDVEAWKRSFK